MDVMTAIETRRSIRQFTSKDIEDEKLLKVLEAARLAPSSSNKQQWKFIVVKERSLIEKFVEAADGQMFVAVAPAIIVGCALEPESKMFCGQFRYPVDLSIAFSFMLLEAHELGLGMCWIGHFFEDRVKSILHIPEKVRVVAISPIGYPSEDPLQRPRKKLDEIICFDKYK